MYLILSDASGKRYECVLIAASHDRLRIAFRGGEDAVELTRCQNQWTSEEYGPVQVESIVAGERLPVAFELPAHYRMAG